MTSQRMNGTGKLPQTVASGQSAADILILNIGGVRHETTLETLNSQPGTKLANLGKLKEHFRIDTKEYFFDRSPRLFDHILNFYRTGQLHLSKSFCARELANELDFWGIDHNLISNCCWVGYRSQCVSHESLRKFEAGRLLDRRHELQRDSVVDMSDWERYRSRAWAVLNYPFSSKLAMAYAVISMLVVVLSIFSLCASTSPATKNTLSLQGYADYYDVDPLVLAEQWRDYDWFSEYFPAYQNSSTADSNRKKRDIPDVMEDTPNTSDIHADITHNKPDLIMNTSDILLSNGNGPDWNWYRTNRSNLASEVPALQYIGDSYNVGETGRDGDRQTQRLMDTLNAVSIRLTKVAQYCEERFVRAMDTSRIKRSAGAVPRTSNSTNNSFYFVWDSALGISSEDLESIDIFCYVFIGIELVLRFIFCPSKKRFLCSAINVFDALAILFYVIEIIINSQRTDTMRVSTYEALFEMRVLRVVRVFRLAKHHKGLHVLVYTIKASLSEIVLLFIILFVGVLFFGSLVYYTDQDETHFLSIGHCLWWAIITMTTVGYGDMTPSSTAGKVAGAACAVSGVLLIAFTVPVIVNNFTMFYDQVQYGKDADYLLEHSNDFLFSNDIHCPNSNPNTAAGKGPKNGKTSTIQWDKIELTDV